MLQRFFAGLLNNMLPRKTKRQIFLVSFAALLKGATTYDRETFQKLNRVLSLSESNDDKALGVSVMLSRVIWNGKTTYEICNDNVSEGNFNADRIAQVMTSLLNSMPRWLKYGQTEEIEKDVTVILNDQMNLLGV